MAPTSQAPTSSAPTVAPPGECENRAYLCNIWASLGYCVPAAGHADYMHAECAAACHTCPGSEIPTPPPNAATTPRPSTPAPTAAVPCHYTSCGAVGRCGSQQAGCAAHGERHEVRCCADTAIAGWRKRSDTCPWTESDNFNSANSVCLSDKTFNEANDFCASVGARLCTVAEAEDNCLRGTGCGHDVDQIWTSDAGTLSRAIAARMAFSVDGEAAPLRQVTSTAEPDVDLEASSAAGDGDGDGESDPAAVIGAVFGALAVVAVVVVLFVLHHKGRPGAGESPKAVDSEHTDNYAPLDRTVEEGSSIRFKSVRRGNPAYINSVAEAPVAENVATAT